VRKATLVLHKWLRQNSADNLTYITDGMANIEMWEEKRKSGISLLQAVDAEKKR